MGSTRACRRLGVLAAFAAAYTYALIVFGGIVRITGSGMGCGDDWPRCNGQWIPEFTFETLIEYTHRLLGAGIGVVVLAVFAYAWFHRNSAGVGGRGGPLRAIVAGAILLAVQIVLGAVTVRLELPTGVTVAHFITAMLFMATLIWAAIRGTGGSWRSRDPRREGPGAVRGGALAPPGPLRPEGERGAGGLTGGGARRAWRAAIAALILGLLVVSLGALTANTPVAPQACRGFPLCSGELFPANTPAHVQWTHRLLAFLLLFHVMAAAWSSVQRGASPAVRSVAFTALGLIVVQFGVAVALVTLPLPRDLQVAHLVIGVAVWAALVVWAELARIARDDGASEQSEPFLDPRRDPA
ncbi:MAG: COX15/CtaA family protein [Longimicrobiales bacterium]